LKPYCQICVYRHLGYRTKAFLPEIPWKSLKRHDINNAGAKQRAHKQKRLILCIFQKIWLRKKFSRKKQTLICYHKYLIILTRHGRISCCLGLLSRGFKVLYPLKGTMVQSRLSTIFHCGPEPFGDDTKCFLNISGHQDHGRKKSKFDHGPP
jgi:hypothetical protein